MRKLASIQRVVSVSPIEGADKIEKLTVLGWELVAKKGEFKPGDAVIYVEVDSILPDRPEFEFMRERKFRVKTIKLRGQISQGICFPLSILPSGDLLKEGADVTDMIGIEKYDPYPEEQRMLKQTSKIMYPKWMPDFITGYIHRFRFVRNYFRHTSGQKTFPSLIPKTDETRVQVLQPLLDKYKGCDCYYTEKLDGSSITVYQINGKFGVCSRKIDLKKDPDDKFWKAVIEHDMEAKFKRAFGKTNIALQGELIGSGIQGNKYKLTGHDIYFFNVYFIREGRYGNIVELMDICDALGEKTVPILDMNYKLSNSIPELVELSKGVSKLNGTLREGIVIRPLVEIEDSELHCQLVKNRISFKSVNPDFLLKYGD